MAGTLIGLAAVLSGMVLLAMTAISPQPSYAAAGPAVTIGGPFELRTSGGTTVTDRTFRGKWMIVYFGYTSCADSCPTSLAAIAAALKKLGPDAAGVQPLFITLDPRRDTPDVLAKYTQSFDLRILGLTGTAGQLAAVVQAYGAYGVTHATGRGADEYVIDHSIYIYVMDPRGTFVRAFDADVPADRLAAVLHALLARDRNKKSAASVAGQ